MYGCPVSISADPIDPSSRSLRVAAFHLRPTVRLRFASTTGPATESFATISLHLLNHTHPLAEPPFASSAVAQQLGFNRLDIHGDPRLVVDCREAERNIRLHLWILGIGAADKKALLGRAVAALKGEVTGEDAQTLTFSITTPAFDAQ